MNDDLRNSLKKILESALKELASERGLDSSSLPPISLEVPKDTRFGDAATNVAMKSAPFFKCPPMDIATAIVERLPSNSQLLRKAEAVKPGFINFFIHELKMLGHAVASILSEGHNYGRSKVGNGKKINVEFISANPTGPLHIGHGRQAVIGDVLASALDWCGFQVTREYYYNDAGTQMNLLGQSLWVRYQQLFGRQAEIPENGYVGDYIIDIAKQLRGERGDEFLDRDIREVLDFFRTYAADNIIVTIDRDLRDLGIKFDSWVKESGFHQTGKVDAVLAELERRGLVYEQEGAKWFRSSAFGDEKDRVVVKKSGDKTYFAPDIAYLMDKRERGFDQAINIWGADHHSYADRMRAAVLALGYPADFHDVVIHQMVSFVRGGEEIKMSTRQAKFLTLSDLIKELGRDVVRYFFVMRNYQSHLVFDFDLAKKQSSENPVYYIQYAHARICSILDHAKEKGFALEDMREANLSLLREKEEQELIKELGEFPRAVEATGLNREVHRIPNYLLALTKEFHSYYNKHRVVTENKELSLARLALTEAVRTVVANGLTILGITAPKKM